MSGRRGGSSHQRVPEGADRSLEHGRVREVEAKALPLQQLSGGSGLLMALLAERAVEPAGELVLAVPGALAVPDEHQRVLASRRPRGEGHGGAAEGPGEEDVGPHGDGGRRRGGGWLLGRFGCSACMLYVPHQGPQAPTAAVVHKRSCCRLQKKQDAAASFGLLREAMSPVALLLLPTTATNVRNSTLVFFTSHRQYVNRCLTKCTLKHAATNAQEFMPLQIKAR